MFQGSLKGTIPYGSFKGLLKVGRTTSTVMDLLSKASEYRGHIIALQELHVSSRPRVVEVRLSGV